MNRIKRNTLRLLILSAALFLFAGAPAYAFNDNGVEEGDTISIYYEGKFLAADGNGVYAADEMSTDALWRVVERSGTGFRLQRIAERGNQGYLRLNPNSNWLLSYYSLSIANQRQGSVLSMKDVSAAVGGWQAKIYYNNTYYLYYDNLPGWDNWYFDDAKSRSYDLHIEQWRRKEERSLDISCSEGSSVAFPFVDEKNCFAADQATTRHYEVTQTIVTYIGSLGNNTTRLEEKKGTVYPSARPSFAWRSGTGTTSMLLATMIDSTGETYTEHSRPMLEYSKLTGYGNGKWSVVVAPQGRSPMNLKDKDGLYTDFQDVLVATVTSGGQTVSDEVHVTRYAGHYGKSGFNATISPASKQFGSAGGMREFQETFELVEGERILGVAGNVLHNGSHTYDNSVTTSVSYTDLGATYKVLLPDGSESTAVKVTSTNPLILTVDANPGDTKRMATLYATYSYQAHTATVAVLLVQIGATEKITAFHHQPGMGNTALDERGFQPVHTLYTTIYYAPASRVRLTLNEKAYIGYRRWYNYNTDGDPMYNPDGSEITDFWAQGPVGNKAFIPINSGSDSKGRYAYGDMLNYQSTTFPEVNTAHLGGNSYDIACDVSAYTDYSISDASITEPTLSYRQIFYLRPADDMANRVDTCTTNYLESHNLVVPTEREVLLATNFAHHYAEHESELCYFYHDKSGKLQRVGKDVQVSWYVDGVYTPNIQYKVARGGAQTDYVEITSKTVDTVTYELRLRKEDTRLDADLLLVKFVVMYMNRAECGPSITGLITEKEIEDRYILLSKKDFDYAQPASAAYEAYNHHLSWEEATYGYTYPELVSAGKYKRAVQDAFPYYGEYAIVNRVDKNWAKAEQHGGAANGYCMYVDGTQRTGRVVSINTQTRICAGQQLYCCAWLCNPNVNEPTAGGANIEPRFRFSIQGRNGNGPWEDVGEFMTGPIKKEAENGVWKQVMFPVVSASNYDESRVSIYNFSTTNSGNDFMIDDVFLFASKLPLQAYQATTTCASDDREVILCRLDYTTLTDDWADKFMYYQIYDVSDNKPFQNNYYREQTGQDGAADDEYHYGYVSIPPKAYTPKIMVDTIYPTASAFIDNLKRQTDNDEDPNRIGGRKAYVQVDGIWVLFIGVVVSKDLLVDEHDFEVRMAVDTADLKSPDCALQTPLAVTNRSSFLFDGKATPQLGACANNLYPINVVVTNQYVTSTGDVRTLQAAALADWLVGYPFDTCYEKNALMPNAAADAAFEVQYGYSRDEVKEALRLLRRDEDHPNYRQNDIYRVTPVQGGLSRAQIALLTDLVERGLLTLAQETVPCYLTVGDTVMYWVFPILGTAIADHPEKEGEKLTLKDCNDPSFMRMSADTDGYVFNLSPVKKEDADPALAGQIPAVRISADEAKKAFYTTVSECSPDIDLVPDSCRLVATNDPALQTLMSSADFAAKFMFSNTLDIPNGHLVIQPKSDNLYAMRPGYEYTMRVKMRTKDGVVNSSGCDVGYAYLVVKVVPETMVWTPTVSNEWGDDRNWRAIVDGKTLDYGYTPLEGGTDVIIPALDDPAAYPCITTTNRYPLDARYTPAGCRNIRFCKGTVLLNQHLLQYDSAFVDMALQSARWYSMSSPLKDVYSGDLFIPHSGEVGGAWTNEETADDFRVAPFAGARTTTAAYAFWTAYYNKAVKLHHTPDYATTVSSATTDFAFSNGMDEPFAPGQGLQILGYGPGADGEELLVRLPKPDTRYDYFDLTTGKPNGKVVTLDRTNSHRLAYEPAADGVMSVTMTNLEPSEYFLFGNPAMAYIDMAQFLSDNSDVLTPGFLYMDGSSWTAVTPGTTPASEALLAPMRAVLLMANAAGTSLTVRLREGLLVNPVAQTAMAKPRRLAAGGGWSGSAPAVMTIAVHTPTDDGDEQPYASARAMLAADASAADAFVAGEDVPFVSSGVESEGAVVSPLNIYTVAGEDALMADVRRSIGRIPLGFVIGEDVRNAFDSLVLSFALSLPWTEECWFCDHLTGARTPVYNDTRVRIPVPADHEARYYIEGSSAAAPDTPTSVDTPADGTASSDPSLFVRTDGRGGVSLIASAPMTEVRAYDVLGRRLYGTVLSVPAPVHNLRLPAGVAVLEVLFPSGATIYSKIYIRP